MHHRFPTIHPNILNHHKLSLIILIIHICTVCRTICCDFEAQFVSIHPISSRLRHGTHQLCGSGPRHNLPWFDRPLPLGCIIQSCWCVGWLFNEFHVLILYNSCTGNHKAYKSGHFDESWWNLSGCKPEPRSPLPLAQWDASTKL